MEYDLTDFRKSIAPMLDEQGFSVSAALPVLKEISLRPTRELACRLAAVKLLGAWTCFSESEAPAQPFLDYAESFNLRDYLGEEESSMLETPRSEAMDRYQQHIGWKFEGAWALAWVLGYEDCPDHLGEMISDETVVAVIRDFSPDDRSAPDLNEWAARKTLRSLDEVAAMEDLFYCVHNAARSAQLGDRDCVPEWFHPIVNGGVIHERRHALKWALHPKESWDDVDLST